MNTSQHPDDSSLSWTSRARRAQQWAGRILTYALVERIDHWLLLAAISALMVGSLSFSSFGVGLLLVGAVALIAHVLLKRTRRASFESTVALLIGTAPLWRLLGA